MAGRGASRIAFVHDWLTGMRGGEKVLEVLCERFPEASVFTLVHVAGSVSEPIERLRPRASFVQHLPGVRRWYRQYLPLFTAAVELFDLGGFDLVVSSSHCVAKGAITLPPTRHICYCHTPMRYAWDQFDNYFGPQRIGRAASSLMRPVMARFARWDRDTAYRVHRYLTNSHYVASRIRRYYNREATVVYPPVDTDFFQPDSSRPDGSALIVSALVPYKRIDVAIDACRQARVPLTIAGDGPERPRLERAAGARGNNVRFLGRVPAPDLRDLYRRAAIVLLPGEEDFGIAPVEAQACGRPVVALGRGGAAETIVPGETGVLVDDPGSAALADGISRALATDFDSAAIRRHAERFSRVRFGDEMEAIIRHELATQT